MRPSIRSTVQRQKLLNWQSWACYYPDLLVRRNRCYNTDRYFLHVTWFVLVGIITQKLHGNDSLD